MLVKFCKFFSLVAVLALLAAPAAAEVIFDDDFTEADGHIAGDARASGEWTGQAGTTAEPSISTATVSNAWVGITNVNGVPTTAPNQKYTATFDFKYRNFAASNPGMVPNPSYPAEPGAPEEPEFISVNGNTARLGLTTESPLFGGGGIQRLGNNDSKTMEANLNKQDGQMTFQLGSGGTASAVVTDADLGFDFSGGADDSDNLRVVYMATPTAVADTWDVMATLDNLDNPFANGPVVLSESIVNADTYLPSSLGENVSDNLYAGFANSGYGGAAAYPPGGRGDPLSGLAFDRVALDAVVPEPATFAMACFGCLAMAGLRRRS